MSFNCSCKKKGPISNYSTCTCKECDCRLQCNQLTVTLVLIKTVTDYNPVSN